MTGSMALVASKSYHLLLLASSTEAICRRSYCYFGKLVRDDDK